MNSFSYLKAKLADIVKAIPYIRVRYSYDPEFLNHIVEIKPAEVYQNDTIFAERESELCLDFSNKYPYDSIIFVSENDIVKIDKADFVLNGRLFDSGFVIPTILTPL